MVLFSEGEDWRMSGPFWCESMMRTAQLDLYVEVVVSVHDGRLKADETGLDKHDNYHIESGGWMFLIM